MKALLLAAIELITLHMIDGRVVRVNPMEITRMAASDEKMPNKALVSDVHCVIWFTDGKYLSVSETCAAVQELMREPQ